MKRKKLLICLNVIIASLVFLSCNKQNRQQPPTSELITTTANLKTDVTAVLLTDATALAKKFLQFKNPNTNTTIKTAETVTKNGVPYMHIINANKGFVILSADSIYAPLLAYDSIGNFDKGNLNPGLVMWFNKHGHELEFMRNTKTAYADSIATLNKNLWQALSSASAQLSNQAKPGNNGGAITNGTSQGHVVYQNTSYYSTNTTVGPLLHSHWVQNQPFNQFCPPGNYVGSGHMPAGCVPVAIGQVMGFWQYGINYNNGSVYNWSIMPIQNH